MTAKKELVWEKAKPMRSNSPGQYRRDPGGRTITRDSCGKESAVGWEFDHIKPKARGGFDRMRNLQALQWATNSEKDAAMDAKMRHLNKANK